MLLSSFSSSSFFTESLVYSNTLAQCIIDAVGVRLHLMMVLGLMQKKSGSVGWHQREKHSAIRINTALGRTMEVYQQILTNLG